MRKLKKWGQPFFVVMLLLNMAAIGDAVIEPQHSITWGDEDTRFEPTA